jgi:NodT family efflux transporter outer membrane factor (OMF) lipoprotein
MVAACAVGPNYHRPALSPSAGYGPQAITSSSTKDIGGGRSAATLIENADVPSDWWDVFHCADLNALVAQALKNSPTVEAAKAALRAAREQVRAQRGAYLPAVSASVQPTRQRFAPNLSSPLQSGSDTYSLTTSQVSVSYAPDLFGANARAVESLVAQQDQQRFELEAARLTLATNVVQAAVQDALLRAEIQTTKSIIADQMKTWRSYERQYQLGQVANADLAAQAALLAQARATLPPLEKQFQINRDLLNALVGRTPGEPLEVGFSFQSLSLPDRLPLSLPAQIVEHRPDVRIAEAELHAASAEVGVAAAARWPSLQLDAGAGSAALGLTPVFNSSANFWSLAATLTQPIFEGGALLHRERSAKALYEEAASQYQATVVGAFQNTADVLHALWGDAETLQLAEEAETASSKSLEIARRQLALGDLSRLAMLSAEQAQAQSRLVTLQAQANRYADVAALFQALGGGWWNSAEPAASAKRGSWRP